MLPSWLVIAIVTVAVAVVFNRLSSNDIRWFNHLRRPPWLTFEKAIPAIWTFIFICGAWSAYIIWEADAGSRNTWFLMGFYLLLELVIIAYTPVMCKLKSLTVGTIIGGLGFVLGFILALIVIRIVVWAFVLLLPYLLWSPIGTYVTWAMIRLNPGNA
ncbi:TspO/MBR family protein [Gloeothece verrucosa]|uniref:TspO and MBR like protein n=1 Tax=Gloeothece verrucosa (strain PCC 7822) TaxID=497965 RepID=E0UAM6_GLOV7|nr:TspO/MBR family protein [Gloeothece verrucosa]ADN13878.1 TspO and MBR like protein [Gloeothece verrucosa PCC 7822]